MSNQQKEMRQQMYEEKILAIQKRYTSEEGTPKGESRWALPL